jgi:hypothetical protein
LTIGHKSANTTFHWDKSQNRSFPISFEVGSVG